MTLGLKSLSVKRIHTTRVVASKYWALGMTFVDCFLAAGMGYITIQITLANC